MSVADNVEDSVESSKATKKILDEENYTQELEKIIERDFFPDLPKLKAQTEYLDALKSNNAAKVREIQVKYCPKTNMPGTSLSSLYNTPSTFDTPIGGRNNSPSKNREEENQAINNEKFNKGYILSRRTRLEQSRKTLTFLRSRLECVYVLRTLEKVLRTHMHVPIFIHEKKLSLDQFLRKYTSEDNESFQVITKEAEKQHMQKYPWLYKDEHEEGSKLRNLLQLPPHEHKDRSLTMWSYTNMNALMYVPDGCELTPQEKITYAKHQEVVHDNSRYQTPPFNDQINKAVIAEAASVQAKMKEGKVGIDGKEILPEESPQVNGYSFVSTPSPAPGVSESPLMTWGEIEGTPFRLDGSDTPLPQNVGGPQFKIPDLPARERIALSLADKVAKQHRTRKREAMQRVHSSLLSPSPFRSNTPRTPVERLSSMSPAAQKLARSKLGINRGTDKALQASYSPSPLCSPGTKTPLLLSTPTPLASQNTPKTSEVAKKTVLEETSLTDNLLNLPKRAKAADFF